MYDAIREQRSWYSISLPLHYPSTYDGEDYATALDENRLADLFKSTIDVLVPEGKYHLVGYSVGGFAVMNYAAKYPERVLSVISIGGFMTGWASGLEGILQFFSQGKVVRKAMFHAGYWLAQRHRLFFKLATITYARRWRKLLRYPALDPTIDRVFPDFQKHDRAGQRAWFKYLLDMNLLDETQKIKHPVLVIAGDQDPIIPYGHQITYAGLLPNGKLLTLPGVGHVSFAEAPEVVRTGVLGWLERYDLVG